MSVAEMTKRSRAIEISSSSEQENGDDDYDAASRDDFDSSASSESDGDYEDEDDVSYSSGSQEDDDEDIQEESRCDRVLRGCGELRKLRTELRKLTLTDCKTYLRSNGLRLSGTKEECIQRIIEHWRMKDGNGQRQYPRSSFTINCTGS